MPKLDQCAYQKQQYNPPKNLDFSNFLTNHALCLLLIAFHNGGDGEIPTEEKTTNHLSDRYRWAVSRYAHVR